MISKKDLKDYKFRTIEDYFEYIDDSRINGQFSQVKSLFKALSEKQKEDCLSYLELYFGHITIDYLKEECLN